MAHSRRSARCRKRENSPFIRTTLICSVCLLLLAVGMWSRSSSQQARVREQTEICTRLDIFVSLVQTGIVPPPNPTEEQIVATELANSKLRVALQAALGQSPCG